jgi:hypothetical protein
MVVIKFYKVDDNTGIEKVIHTMVTSNPIVPVGQLLNVYHRYITPGEEIVSLYVGKTKLHPSIGSEIDLRSYVSDGHQTAGIDGNEYGVHVAISKAAAGGRQRSASNCKRRYTKKYTERNSPPFPANECQGMLKRGNDMHWYRSTADYRGIHRWIAVKSRRTVSKSPIKKRKDRSRSKTPAARRPKD